MSESRNPLVPAVLAVGAVLFAVLIAGLGCGEQISGAAYAEAPTAPAAHAAARAPLNVVLMIGDGMGLTQVSAALYANGGKLSLERMRVIGLHKSYSADDLVTDSAAGATAFSCGVKTINGAVGVEPDGTPCTTLLERAEAAGMPTGLVATSTIVHATPAAFYAHVPSRQQYEDIAAALVGSGVDYAVGGGQGFFDQRTSDTRDLLEELRERGNVVSSYFDGDFVAEQAIERAPYVYLSSAKDPLPQAQGRNYLVPATGRALDFLEARDSLGVGFFLVVEGSQIDWGGHANDSEYIISETLEFAEAVERVLDWADKRGNTLVVVTADHETGGYAINKGSRMGKIEGAFTSDYHTADLVPVYASGPGAEMFGGIYENTAIHDKILTLLRGRL